MPEEEEGKSDTVDYWEYDESDDFLMSEIITSPLALTKLCCLSLLQSTRSEDAVHAQLQEHPAALGAWNIFLENVKNCTIDAGREEGDDNNKSANMYYYLFCEYYDKKPWDNRFDPEPGLKKVIELIVSDAVVLLSGRALDGGEDQRMLIEEIEFLKVGSETNNPISDSKDPRTRYFISHRDRRICAMFDYDGEIEITCSLEDRLSLENPLPRPVHRRMEYGDGWHRRNTKTHLDMSPLPLQTRFVMQRVLQALTNVGISVEKPQWMFLHTAGTNGG